MKKQPNEAIRKLRKILGITQAEFAVMVGVSKDAVVSWETGRNQVSASIARRIALVTGVDDRMLRLGIGYPVSQVPGRGGEIYTAEDYEKHRQMEGNGADEASLQRRLGHCQDTMELLLRAAVAAGGERHRLPGVMDSFMQWCETVREDFGLGAALDGLLEQRRFRAGMTQQYRDWRAMARSNPEGLKAAGYVDEPNRGDREELRLELDMVPTWMPGRSMQAPRPAGMRMAKGEEGEEGES